MIAYHVVHLTRLRLKAHGINLSRLLIRECLADWRRSTITWREAEGGDVTCRLDSWPDAETAEIARAAVVAIPRRLRWSG